MNIDVIDGIQKWIAIGATVLAAGAGVLKFREKADKIKVTDGTISPQSNPGEFLNVVSRCDHSVQLADYGYVMRTGKLFSILDYEANWPDNEQRLVYGSSFLECRNASFETGMTLRDQAVGVYAITTSQNQPTIGFRYNTPRWMRFWFRARLWWKVGYDRGN